MRAVPQHRSERRQTSPLGQETFRDMATEEDARKLFVAGLPETVTDEGLRALFVSTGSGIDELSLPRDRATGRPRGFAFVTLSSREEAERARQQLDGSLLDGRSISVRPFSSGGPP